jgi:hypothetical protein
VRGVAYSKRGYSNMTRLVWLVIGAGVASAISVVLMRVRARSTDLDVGAVSDQWIAEHRAGIDDGLYQ